MNKLISHILLICFFILNAHFVFADEKLVFALDLVRHGDRSPTNYMPKISNAWAKEEMGKLTLLGKKQAKLLGENFRKYYIDKTHLLPKEFQPNLIYVRSTNFQRTKETARSILEGMFPINSNKINIIVPSTAQDILSPTNKRKDRALISKKVLKEISLDKKFIAALKKQLKSINKIFNTNFIKLIRVSQVGDLIKISEIHKKPLLKKLSAETKENIVSLGNKNVLKFYAQNRVSCLYAKDSVLHIADVLKSKHKQKYFLYTAHYSNIMTIASLLNFHLKKMPPYLSDLRFEMFQDTNDNKVFIRTSLDGKNIKICQSSNDCPLEEFVKTLRENAQNKCSSF